jgi:hypothetical protein
VVVTVVGVVTVVVAPEPELLEPEPEPVELLGASVVSVAEGTGESEGWEDPEAVSLLHPESTPTARTTTTTGRICFFTWGLTPLVAQGPGA